MLLANMSTCTEKPLGPVVDMSCCVLKCHSLAGALDYTAVSDNHNHACVVMIREPTKAAAWQG